MVAIEWNPGPKKLRNFGFFAFLGFGLMALLVAKRNGALTADEATGSIAWGFISLFAALALACPLLSLTFPKALRPVWITLSLVAVPIGFVISHIVMSLIFYGLFTPLALFFKLIGRDPMQRKLAPDAETYWEKRPPAPEAKRYFRQF